MVGIEDRRLGQVPVLCAVVKEGGRTTEEEVRAFLRQRVAAYKVPRRVLFFDDGEIPMTGSSTKVRDQELIDIVQARLAAGEGDQ